MYGEDSAARVKTTTRAHVTCITRSFKGQFRGQLVMRNRVRFVHLPMVAGRSRTSVSSQSSSWRSSMFPNNFGNLTKLLSDKNNCFILTRAQIWLGSAFSPQFASARRSMLVSWAMFPGNRWILFPSNVRLTSDVKCQRESRGPSASAGKNSDFVAERALCETSSRSRLTSLVKKWGIAVILLAFTSNICKLKHLPNVRGSEDIWLFASCKISKQVRNPTSAGIE